MAREQWGTRLGVIMAVAGSAVGLGNFLRFPAQATLNGGGAFMIPYLICLVLLGLPLMWMEWAGGRYAGSKGHTTAPGMCFVLTKSSLFRYLGVLGLVCPLIVFFYYTYIESWLLGYAYFAVSGAYDAAAVEPEGLQQFLKTYQGREQGTTPGLGSAYVFFLLTFCTNFYFLYRGLAGGIEKLCNWALPVLFVLAIVIAVRVLTLGAPNPAVPLNSVGAGMDFLWRPDFSALTDGKTWLAAAGQIFFTLSVGFGVIVCYAGHVKRDEDVALSGLTATSLNEFAEVILGGSIVIPLAFAFLGTAGAMAAAKDGLFTLGFVTTPLIFHQMAAGAFFAFLWYALLFLAGITSSVSLAQPIISFLQDEFKWSRAKSVLSIGAVAFVVCNFVIIWPMIAIDEMDTWASNIGILVFGLIECIAFMWLFGSHNAWEELQRGAKIKIPGIFRFIMKFVTPTIILVTLVTWFYQGGYRFVLLLDFLDPANRTELTLRVFMRLVMLAIIGIIVYLIYSSSEKTAGTLAEQKQAAEVI